MTKLISRFDQNANPPVFDAVPVSDGLFRVTNAETNYDETMPEATVLQLFQRKPIKIDAARLYEKIKNSPDEGCVEAGWMHPEAPLSQSFHGLHRGSTDLEIIAVVRMVETSDFAPAHKLGWRIKIMDRTGIDRVVYDAFAKVP